MKNLKYSGEFGITQLFFLLHLINLILLRISLGLKKVHWTFEDKSHFGLKKVWT